MAQVLNSAEIQTQLGHLSGWKLNEKTIESTRTFEGFPGAIAFVKQLVEPAESAGHHPDIAISYNKVTVSLSSHDAGGLTQKDFDLATIITQIG